MTKQTEVAREIEALIAWQIERWNRHDVEAYASLWMEDADLVNVIGMHLQGRTEIHAELAYLHTTWFRATLVRDLGHCVRLVSPDIAVIRMRWEMTGVDQSAPHTTLDGTRRGIMTHVAARTSEGWRFVASQNTDIAPMPDVRQAELEPSFVASAD